MVLFGLLWFLSEGHRAVSGKWRSLPDSTQWMTHSSRGERKTAFIGWVFLSLVACTIWVTTVKFGGGDLTAGDGQACFVDRETWAIRSARGRSTAEGHENSRRPREMCRGCI